MYKDTFFLNISCFLIVGRSKSHSRRSSQSGTGNNSGAPPTKKPKSSAKDVLAEAGKHSNYTEMALFDKVIQYICVVTCSCTLVRKSLCGMYSIVQYSIA